MVKSSKGSSSNHSTGKSKFAVYEFDVEDDRVEKDAHKILSKFKSRKPREFSTSPVYKYDFLRYFAQGTKTVENVFENEPLDVDKYFKDKEERTQRHSVVSCSSESDELSHSPTDILDSSCSFPGEFSCIQKGRRPRGYLNDNEHNQPLCVDSDDEQENKESLQNVPICIDSDDDLVNAGNGGLEEQLSNLDSNALHSEPTVVVKPDCVILGNMYSTVSTLTFSCRSIKLDGLIVDGTKRYSGFSWPISDIVKINCFWYRELTTVMVCLHLKCEDEQIAEIDSRCSEETGLIQLKFSVNDPKWCERQEAIESLDLRYKTILDTVVHNDPMWSEFSPLEQNCMYFPKDCSANEVFKDVIYPEGDPDAVSISKKDIELLQPATFINDTIIDFYVKYLSQNIKPDQKHRFHFFNSFFFRKLADLDKDLSTASEGRAAFQRVRKWTRKVNLFKKDFLFIPVNFSLHWSLVVVCHPGEAAYCRNEEKEKPLKVPCILHMDSIRGYHRGLNNLFQSYLWEEWKARHNDISEDVYNNFLNVPFISMELPQQENSFDCGLFLLFYVERFLQQAPVNFSPSDDASVFLNKEWFQPAEASSRRGYIKSLIYQIYNENAEKLPPVADEGSLDSVLEVDIGKGFLLEICDGREACQNDCSGLNADEQIQKASQAAKPGQSPPYLGRSNFTRGDVWDERENASSVTKRTYQDHEKMGSLNQTCHTLSPIEEEEASGERRAISSTCKTGDRNAATSVSVVPLNLDYENVEISMGGSGISPELQDEEECVPEVLMVSVSEERDKRNETSFRSSEELASCVVEDSQEENDTIVIEDDDVNSHIHEARSYDFCDLVNDSPCTSDENAADHIKSVAASEVEQDHRTLKGLAASLVVVEDSDEFQQK